MFKIEMNINQNFVRNIRMVFFFLFVFFRHFHILIRSRRRLTNRILNTYLFNKQTHARQTRIIIFLKNLNHLALAPQLSHHLRNLHELNRLALGEVEYKIDFERRCRERMRTEEYSHKVRDLIMSLFPWRVFTEDRVHDRHFLTLISFQFKAISYGTWILSHSWILHTSAKISVKMTWIFFFTNSRFHATHDITQITIFKKKKDVIESKSKYYNEIKTTIKVYLCF